MNKTIQTDDEQLSAIATELLRYILGSILDNGDIDVDAVDKRTLVDEIEGYYDSPGVEEKVRTLCFEHGLALDTDVDDLCHNGELDLISEQSMSTYRRMIDDIRLPKLNHGEVSTSEEMTEAIKAKYEILVGRTMRVTLCETDEVVLATIKRFESTDFGPHPAEADFEGCDNLIEVWAMVECIDDVSDAASRRGWWTDWDDELWMVSAVTILERGFSS